MNTANHLSVWTLILDASPIVKLVLLLLTFASIWSWTIITTKTKRTRSARAGNQEFLDLFWNARNLEEVQSKVERFPHSPVAQIFESGYRELRKLPSQERTQGGLPELGNVERALHRSFSVEMDRLEAQVDWLATVASAAPFVGLFGTVWGIMNSFQNIGATGAASLAVVAPGISEALVATAIGLAAAIPAAIAYNTLLQRIRRVGLDCENFVQDFLNMVQRSLLTGRKSNDANT